MSLKDFQIVAKLGQGAYSTVYIVKRLQDQQQYALKKVKLQNLTQKEKENALTEIRILASMKCENIVSYKESFVEGNYLYIVMEYMNNGDLFQKIQQNIANATYFSEENIWNIFIQILMGLRALHRLKILHRDLKSANVFLNKQGVAKLGDMNVSKVAKKGLCQTQTGTPYYASPQVWNDQVYDSKSDIWSLGCILYEMIMLKPPFKAEDMEGLYKKITKGIYPKILPRYSQQLSQIVKSLLQTDPQLRPSCQQILNSQIIRQRWGKGCMSQSHDEFSFLLKTIKMPKNLKLSTSMLPLASYKKYNQSEFKSLNLSFPAIQHNQIQKQNKKEDRRQKQNKLKIQNIKNLRRNQSLQLLKKNKNKVQHEQFLPKIKGNQKYQNRQSRVLMVRKIYLDNN